MRSNKSFRFTEDRKITKEQEVGATRVEYLNPG